MTLDLSGPPGSGYAGQPEWARAHARDLVMTFTEHLPRAWHALADLVRVRTRGRFDAEVRAIAAWAGVPWRRAMLGNVAAELALGRLAARPRPADGADPPLALDRSHTGLPGCSTLALATPSGPVLARNLDFWPPEVLSRTSAVVRYRDAAGERFTVAAWPGSVAVATGLSHRGGFALATNAVPVGGRVNPLGWPVLLAMRGVLEDARSFEQALDMVVRARLAGPVAVILCGTRNEQRAVVERIPGRAGVRRPERDGAPLVATNDCRAVPPPARIPAWFRTSGPRFERLAALADGSVDPDDDRLLGMLTDPGVRQSFTAQHAIIRPGHGVVRMWAA